MPATSALLAAQLVFPLVSAIPLLLVGVGLCLLAVRLRRFAH